MQKKTQKTKTKQKKQLHYVLPYLDLCFISTKLAILLKQHFQNHVSYQTKHFQTAPTFQLPFSSAPNPPSLSATPVYDSSGGLLDIESQATERVG